METDEDRPINQTLNLAVSDKARKALRRYVGVYGKQTKIASRVIEWFCLEADDALKAVILGTWPTSMRKAYADALRKMADQIKAEKR